MFRVPYPSDAVPAVSRRSFTQLSEHYDSIVKVADPGTPMFDLQRLCCEAIARVGQLEAEVLRERSGVVVPFTRKKSARPVGRPGAETTQDRRS